MLPSKKTADARTDVGSGKMPNKYYVTTSGDFYVNTKEEPSDFNWASETIDWKSTYKGETFGPFDSFPDAHIKLEELASGIYDGGEPETDKANSVFIEDHISGVIYEEIYSGSISQFGYKFRADTHNDTSFTSKRLGYDILTEVPPVEESGEEVEAAKKTAMFGLPDDLDDVRESPIAYGLPEEAGTWTDDQIIEALSEFADSEMVGASKKVNALKTYEISFVGRKKDAIGIMYPITETVQAENEEDAVLKLYDKYDHITRKNIKEVPEKTAGVEGRYTLKELQAMDTISQGQFDNLKIETPDTQVWLSRMTVEDGMPYNNQVTVEELKDGNWEVVDEYEAKSTKTASEVVIGKDDSNKIGKAIAKIQQLTDENDHNGAILELAFLVDNDKSAKIIKHIMEIHELVGSMPHTLIEYRNELANNLMASAKEKFGEDVADKINAAF